MNNTPTPRTDFAIKASNGQWSYVLKLCAEELERELAAVTEQRDRLAEALQKLNEYDLGDIPVGVVRICEEALQSLNQPTP